jgi:hypothetical protein
MIPYSRSAVAGVLAASVAVLPAVTSAQSNCPTFTRTSLAGQDTSGNRFATFPGGFVMLANKLSTDTDGASTAYHPDNIGSTHLCNGVNVYRDGRCITDNNACFAAVKNARDAQWNPESSPAFCVYGFVAKGPSVGSKILWGAGHSSEPLPVQTANDPAPGFFISTTSRPLRAGNGSGVVYADADRLPYLVMPSSLVGASGPTGLLNAGAIVRLRDNHKVYAIVADSNPSPAEVSVAAAQLVHDPELKQAMPITEAQLKGEGTPPYPYAWSEQAHRVRLSSSSEGPYLVFALGARFGKATDYDASKVNALGENAFRSFGGIENLAACAKNFFGN